MVIKNKRKETGDLLKLVAIYHPVMVPGPFGKCHDFIFLIMQSIS